MPSEDELLRRHLNEVKQINAISKKLLSFDYQFQKSNSGKAENALNNLDSLSTSVVEKSNQLKNSNLCTNNISRIHGELKDSVERMSLFSDSIDETTLDNAQLMRFNEIRNTITGLRETIQAVCSKNLDNPEIRHFRLKESEQENMILKKLQSGGESKRDSFSKLRDLSGCYIDFDQKSPVSNGDQKNAHIGIKFSKTITIALIFLALSPVSLFLAYENLIAENPLPPTGPLKSHYLIQDLRGDTIDTWVSWRLTENTTMIVNLLNAFENPDKVELVREVLLSEESIEVEDNLLHKGPKGFKSTMYLGWAGALNEAAKKKTHFHIPTKFNLIESQNGEGHITITLTKLKNPDGYLGYTKSIVDESHNQILKTEIMIYEVDRLTDDQFKTILRHELGHAFGLAHSSAPEDLMAPTITTSYPFISECSVQSIIKLYDGLSKGQVVCEK